MQSARSFADYRERSARERADGAATIDAWCDACGAALAILLGSDADLRPRGFVFEDVRFAIRESGNEVAIAVDAPLSPSAVAWMTAPIVWREKRADAVARAIVDAHIQRKNQRERLRVVERATGLGPRGRCSGAGASTEHSRDGRVGCCARRDRWLTARRDDGR